MSIRKSAEALTGFSLTKRNTHHWDIYPARGQWLRNGGHRLFRIRGEPGRVVIFSEMDYPARDDEPRDWGYRREFTSIEAAMAFICGILMREACGEED